MSRLRPTLAAVIVRFFSRLRFPVLFALTAALFVVNLLLPDAIPLIDEILLGAATAVLASWRKRKAPNSGQEDEPEAR